MKSEKLISKNRQTSDEIYRFLVPAIGLEPIRYCYRGILSPLRLPIPPRRRFNLPVYYILTDKDMQEIFIKMTKSPQKGAMTDNFYKTDTVRLQNIRMFLVK